jgi:hypothetical protein
VVAVEVGEGRVWGEGGWGEEGGVRFAEAGEEVDLLEGLVDGFFEGGWLGCWLKVVNRRGRGMVGGW